MTGLSLDWIIIRNLFSVNSFSIRLCNLSSDFLVKSSEDCSVISHTQKARIVLQDSRYKKFNSILVKSSESSSVISHTDELLSRFLGAEYG